MLYANVIWTLQQLNAKEKKNKKEKRNGKIVNIEVENLHIF